MKEDEQKYVYVDLILRGNGLNPGEVTRALALEPNMSFRRGDWRNETDRWKTNLWSISSKGRVHSNDLSSHLEWLINQIEPMKVNFLEITGQDDIEAEISCFWILPTDHEYLSLTNELIRKTAELRLKIGIDVYSS